MYTDEPENVGFKVIVDGVDIYDQFPITGNAMILPNVMGEVWQFELYGTGKVQAVRFHDDVEAL